MSYSIDVFIPVHFSNLNCLQKSEWFTIFNYVAYDHILLLGDVLHGYCHDVIIHDHECSTWISTEDCWKVKCSAEDRIIIKNDPFAHIMYISNQEIILCDDCQLLN